MNLFRVFQIDLSPALLARIVLEQHFQATVPEEEIREYHCFTTQDKLRIHALFLRFRRIVI